MNMGPRRLRSLAVLLLALHLAGCGVFNGLFGAGTTFGGSRQVEFRIPEKLNNDTPVAVELVVVYDPAVEKQLLELPARTWFATREQYKRDFSSEQLETWKWEWTPGQSAMPQTFTYQVGALSTFLFASYASPGDHRIRVVPNKNLRVILHENRFEARMLP